MIIIETNAALGYMEYANFIKIPENDNRYLCIFSNEEGYGRNNKVYYEGDVYEFEFPSEYTIIPIHKHDLVIDRSPLKNTFLFDIFLKTIRD